MKEVTRVIAILLLLSFPSLAMADVSSRFPASVQISHEGTTYRAFDLGNFRELLRMDADLAAAIAELEVLQTQVTELRAANSAQTQAITLLEQNVTTLTEERDRLVLRWTDLDREYQECTARPRVSPFLWASLVVSLLASTGLTTYIVLKR